MVDFQAWEGSRTDNGKVFKLIEAVNKMNWGLTLAKVEE